jgi:hypothetical protein
MLVLVREKGKEIVQLINALYYDNNIMRGRDCSAEVRPQHIVEPGVAGVGPVDLHNVLIIESELIVVRHEANRIFILFTNSHGADVLFNAIPVNVTVCVDL